MKRLEDFEPLLPAEKRLADWLRNGNRKFFELAQSVPTIPTSGVTLRATFIRYLALGGCDACRLPETGLRVAGAYIAGDDTLSEDTKGLDLKSATLPHDLVLWDCYIPDAIILRSAKVKNLILQDVVLKAGLEADRMHAEGGVFLRGAKVAGRVRMLGARLGGDLDFGNAKLQAQGEALNCDGMHVEGGFFLCGAEIVGQVRLVGARLGAHLSCKGTKLRAEGRTLSCAGAKISGGFVLNAGAEVSGCIDLSGATLSAINDDPACWPPEILLSRCRYEAFQGDTAPIDAKNRLKWLALQQPKKYGHAFWPDPYEHCAKVLNEMGHDTDARAILIEKEKLQRSARREQLRKAGQTPFANVLWVVEGLLGITTRWGRQPLWAFAWLFGFWIFGTLWFGEAAKRGEIKPDLPQIQRSIEWVECARDGPRRLPEHDSQPDCFVDQPEGQSYPKFSALVYSADALFPVVSLEMQSYWIPDDRQPFGKSARRYLWAHIIAGWALTLLAVAGFSGLIKTDNTK